MLSALYDNYWLPLWQRIKATSDPKVAFDRVMACYQEPHRAYHGVDHVDFVVRTASEHYVRHSCKNHDAVLFALFLHDVIYDTDPSVRDNEEKSAVFSETMLREASVDERFIALVSRLILATKHNAIPMTVDAQVVVDIDLSILGAHPLVFDKYERDIRKEYEHVEEALFRTARKGILEKFLKRAEAGELYSLPFASEAWGWQACKNLRRSIRALS